MDSFLKDLNENRRKRDREQDDSFWSGHSRYQIPARILGYKGKAEALVLSYFYERANTVSFFSAKAVFIEVKVREQILAKRTGLSVRAVETAIISLEVDRAIRVYRNKDKITGLVCTRVYVPLHSETAEPLLCCPNDYGVCEKNFDKPYITAPKQTRALLVQMNASGRQVYLTALAMASKRVSTSFGVSRENWKTESLLGRNAFDRGVKECAANGLLTYRRYVLTLNATSRPKEGIEHENPKWKFDLNAVTAEDWQEVCGALLKRTFIVGDNGWSHATRESLCPFCTEPRSFRVNFKEAKYLCHYDKCARFGRLGQLVQRVLHVTSMSKAKDYIKAVIAKQEAVAA
jgi:hypothetical protein